MKQKYIFLTFGILLSFLSLSFQPQTVSALSGSDFKAGRIIDDGAFFDSSTMNTGSIQYFLNSKVASCDTWGQKPYGNTTRADYGTSRGSPPPYTCLKDYRQTTANKSFEQGLCNGYQASNQSAAEIIDGVAKSCGINPFALIVLLEKEQSLIVDDWPWPIQYRGATGYGCPDTAACDSEYYGFFNQVYNAARQFKKYNRDAPSFRYRTDRDNFIQYNPNGACSGTNVYIENQATAGLYNYTPYQPNAAALANIYGSGDGCSAYGNRNFWVLYNNWFGNGFRENSEIQVTTPVSVSKRHVIKNETTTLSYTVQNKGTRTTDSGVLWICTSLNGKGFGSGAVRKTLVPNETLTVSMPFTPNESGKLEITACGNTPNGPGWVEGYPYSIEAKSRQINTPVNENGVTITSAIASDSLLRVGHTSMLSFSVQNKGINTSDTGNLWICTALNGKPFSSASTRKTLAPNETVTVTMPYTPSEPGTLDITACGNTPNGPGWVANYPIRDYADHGQRQYPVERNPIVISWAVNSDSTLRVGQSANLAYQVKNRSTSPADTGVLWICTSLNGKGYGSGAIRKTLAPNEALIVNLPYTPSETGTLEITACGNTPTGPGWVPNYPVREYPDHGRSTYKVETSPLVISAAVSAFPSLRVGQASTLAYAVQNRSPKSTDTGVLWVCASLNGKGYGSGAVRMTLAPNESIIVSMPFTPSETGKLEVTACGNTPNGPGWVSNYPFREYADHGQWTYSVSN